MIKAPRSSHEVEVAIRRTGSDARTFVRAGFGDAGSALKLADSLERRRTRVGKELVKLTHGKVYRLTDQPVDWLGTVVLVVAKG
jgi:hypothetical protein